MKKHIPNLLTLGNLFCGTIATIAAVQQNYITAAIFVAIGVFLDFLDGLAARLLKVSGDLGKQLDSLADVVTSGVVPGIIMFGLLSNDEIIDVFHENWFGFEFRMIQLLGLLLTLGACYRLAKFNIDTRQNDVGNEAPNDKGTHLIHKGIGEALNPLGHKGAFAKKHKAIK